MGRRWPCKRTFQPARTTWSVTGEVSAFPLLDLVSQELSIVGNLVGTYSELAELATLAAQGRVRVPMSVYPLAAIGDAVRDLEAGDSVAAGLSSSDT